MGIDARWVDEHGDELDVVFDERAIVREIVAAAGSASACLRFVDPYGDTLFNQAQIEALFDELTWMERERLSPPARQQLEKLLALTERARGEAHTYLKFSGD